MKLLVELKLSMELLIFFFVLFYVFNCSVGQYAFRSFELKARTNTFFATDHLQSYKDPHIRPTWCAFQCIDVGSSCKAFSYVRSQETRRCVLHSRRADVGDSNLIEMDGSFYYDMESCSQKMSLGDKSCQVSSTLGVFTPSSKVATTSQITLPTTASSTKHKARPTTMLTTEPSRETTGLPTTTPTTMQTTVPTTVQTTKPSTVSTKESTTMLTTTPTTVVTTVATTLPTSMPTTLETTAGLPTTVSSTVSTTMQTTESTTTKFDSTIPPVLYEDCYEILHIGGSTQSGVYKILLHDATIIYVYCDMDTDGGGWTVIQRRQDGSVDFYRYWDEYVTGFGNLDGEFWLGNHAIYMLTFQYDVQLRFDLEDFNNSHNVAVYDNFRIGDEANFFQLSLGTREQGLSAGDSMKHHNGRKFSTRDQDNDDQNQEQSCAEKFKGGWWYGGCMRANLNGIYLTSPDGPYPTDYAYGLAWYYWHGTHSYSLKFTEMKIRK